MSRERVLDFVDLADEEELIQLFVCVCKKVASVGPLHAMEALEKDESGAFEELQAWFKEDRSGH